MKARADSEKPVALEKLQAVEKLLQEARAEANGLRRKLKMFERIVTSTRLIMGHELKKPSTAISGYLDLALEELEQSGHGEVLDNVKKARGECSLLNELNLFFLELLRMETEEDARLGGAVNLKNFVYEILQHVPAGLRARERVKVKIAPDAQDFHVNASAFKIILCNIIENGLNYSPMDAPVTVEIEKRTDKRGMLGRDLLKIRVTDLGDGIPQTHLKKIFSPFVRLRTDAEGSGLGLTLVRSLVELCDGHVYIESRSGEGSTVHVTIPEADERGGEAP